MKAFIHKYILLIGGVLSAVLIGLDQWTKSLAVTHLKGQKSFVIWDGVFEFHYFENTGAAWGMLKNQQIMFYILTILFCTILFIEIIRLYKNIRYMPLVFTMFLVFAGAVGNFIDRIRLKYVVDFIYFKLIDFPIFNLADCYITVSVVLLLLLLLFVYDDSEFEVIMPSVLKKTKKETN